LEDVRLLIAALILLGVALASARLEKWHISVPAVVVAVGTLLGVSRFSGIDVTIAGPLIKTVAEVTLALMLFHDASRIGLSHLRGQSSLPGRLLGIGLPVMIVLGTLVGYLLMPSLGWLGAALIATMLAPTDAALGEQVVTDGRLPGWLRQGINVESGLNDGLSVPVFLVLIGLATEHNWSWGVLGVQLLWLIGLGVVAGVIFGGVGGLLLRLAHARGWALDEWLQYGALGIALACYVAAAVVGGSGFIGAFVGGLVFGTAAREDAASAVGLVSRLGTVMDFLAFLLLGVVLVPMALGFLSWQVVLYAALSLLVVRGVSVIVAMVGTRAAWPTQLFIGWFGPRGLATVVFTLMLLEENVPNRGLIAAIAVTGVVMSVYAHGFTAPWLAGVYARWYDGYSAHGKPEHADVVQPPSRRAAVAGRQNR
jgi:NhaP-type Na+/H+ or K+/H+ antiporter